MFKKSTLVNVSLALATIGWPLPGMTQVNSVSEGQTPAQTPASIGERLNKGRLQEHEISDIIGGGTPTAPNTDIWRVLNPNEGLPSRGGAPDPNDVIDSAYSSVKLIERALQLRLDYPIGPRTEYMEGQIRRIIRRSAGRTEEMLMRYVLNRTLDTTSLVLPIWGRNTDEVARSLANFQKDSFELAASFANQRVGLVTNLDLGAPYDSAEYLKTLDVAKFGARYARLLWSYSSGLSSTSSKAVMLMQLVNYLGWDVNTDLRRRNEGHAMIIADVYEIQQSDPYRACLSAISAGYEPSSAAAARLRLSIKRLMDTLPERLGE